MDEASRRGHEAAYLSLDPSKAARMLGWSQVLATDEAVLRTAEWYGVVMKDPSRAAERTLHDIGAFTDRIAHA